MLTSSPKEARNQDISVKAYQRLELWRAETTEMVLEFIASSKEAESKLHERISNLCDYICESIEQFTTSPDIRAEVMNILQRAVDIDKTIRRQAARVTWRYCDPSSPFRSQQMSLTSGETNAEENQPVLMIVAPGLAKRGKSTGVDFDKETLLVLPEVSLTTYHVARVLV